MTRIRDVLREEYTIETPENVTFGYEVAGIGNRFIGALIDTTIVFGLLILLGIAVLMLIGVWDSGFSGDLNDSDWLTGLLIALYALLNFIIFWGYYIFFEWFWNGQTPGKKVAKTRVVRLDGNPAAPMQVVVRNLVRVIDFMPSGYGIGLVTMFCNRQSRRLGDFAAGTLVVKDQGELRLEHLLAPNVPPATAAQAAVTALQSQPLPRVEPATVAVEPVTDEDWTGIRRLSPGDYELVQQTLSRTQDGSLDRVLLRRVVRLIATKIGHSPSSYAKLSAAAESSPLAQAAQDQQYLADVLAAYRRWVR